MYTDKQIKDICNQVLNDRLSNTPPVQMPDNKTSADFEQDIRSFLRRQPTERFALTYNFETSTRYQQAIQGTASAVFSNGYSTAPLVLNTGTGVVDNVVLSCNLGGNSQSGYDIFNRNPSISFCNVAIPSFPATDSTSYWFVFGAIDDPSFSSPSIGNKKGFGFYIENVLGVPTLKTYIKKTSIVYNKTITMVNQVSVNSAYLIKPHQYTAIMLSGGGISFYIDNILVDNYINASNLPNNNLDTSSNCVFQIVAYNLGGTTNESFYCGGVKIGYDDNQLI